MQLHKYIQQFQPFSDVGTSRDQNKIFHLVRHFSVTALLSCTAVVLILGFSFQAISRTQLINNEERYHAEMVKMFSNLIWPSFGNYLSNTDITQANYINSAQHEALHTLTSAQIRDSRILKIKIFNRAGNTTYSSELSQIGITKTGYAGFENALNGVYTTQLSFRESFSVNEHEPKLDSRHVVSSYIPIYANNTIQAVIEVYSDVTALIDTIAAARNLVISITVITMALLYGILYLNIRHASSIISAQAKARLHAERKMRWQANHDPLTGLPNRRYFMHLLHKKIASAEQQKQYVTLLFIDLDGFKPINDKFGHQAGDKVLTTVANRLTETLPKDSVVARIGGDEFTAFFTIENLSRAGTDNFHIARLAHVLEQPIELTKQLVKISASIGTSVFQDNTQTPEQLISQADTAMYRSKKSGGGTIEAYNENYAGYASLRRAS